VVVRSVLAGASAVLLLLAAGAWDQSKIWQDSETLWRWSINIDPDCSSCWNNLGTALISQQRDKEAEDAFRRAFALRPARPELATNIATALDGQRKYREAEEMLQFALRLEPNFTPALANLGAVYAQQSRYAESLPYYRQAFAQDPGFTNLSANYRLALTARAAEEQRAARPQVAITLLNEALAVSPADAEARRQLQALVAERAGAGAGPAEPRATR
jgi:tetratricopeptide (TPR) repeat protein